MFKVLKFKNFVITAIVLMIAGIMAVYPSVCVQGAKKGLILSLFKVFPSVFPFMVLSRYITLSGLISVKGRFADKLTKVLFGLPKEALLPFIMGSVSGYPTGAAVLCDMVDKKILTSDQGEHLLPFCNNCSPLFVIGTVGSVIIGSTSVGYILFLIHTTSAIITGMILKSRAPYSKCRSEAYVIPQTQNPFTTAVSLSVTSMLNICGYITLFSVISQVILFVNEDFSLFCGLLEITSGITNIITINIPSSLKLAVISGFLGFSGLCVLLQTSDFTSVRNMSVRKYFYGKIIMGTISFLIALAFFTSYESTAVFNPCHQNSHQVFTVFGIILTLLTVFILFIKNKLE